MKGAIAAFLAALLDLQAQQARCPAMGILITGDEEGRGTYGTRWMLEHLGQACSKVERVLVGEPSARQQTGDQIKIGRRGSLHLDCRCMDAPKHIAYADAQDNLVHRVARFLSQAQALTWDEGCSDFPPTVMQVYGLSAESLAENVTPSSCRLQVNFRFHPSNNPDALVEAFKALLAEHAIEIQSLEARCSAQPFYTPSGPWRDEVLRAVASVRGDVPDVSTSGGTSDGRFFSQGPAQVIELGLPGSSIHQVNESVSETDLKALCLMYSTLLRGIGVNKKG